MTSSGSGDQHGLAELVSHDTVRANHILLAHSTSCLTAVSSYVVRKRRGEVIRLCAKIVRQITLSE